MRRWLPYEVWDEINYEIPDKGSSSGISRTPVIRYLFSVGAVNSISVERRKWKIEIFNFPATFIEFKIFVRAFIDFSRKRHSSFRRLKGTKMENSSSCHRRSDDFQGESIQNHEICLRGCLLTSERSLIWLFNPRKIPVPWLIRRCFVFAISPPPPLIPNLRP